MAKQRFDGDYISAEEGELYFFVCKLFNESFVEE